MDSNMILGFIAIGFIIVFFFVGIIMNEVDNSQKRKELYAKYKNGNVNIWDARDAHNLKLFKLANDIQVLIDKRRDHEEKKHAFELNQDIRWEKSDINVRWALDNIEASTHKCNKCYSDYMRIWNLNPTLIELRCENCKKKFTYLNDSISNVDFVELNDDIQSLFSRLNEENKYLRKVNFPLDFEGHKSNSPNTYPIIVNPTLDPVVGRRTLKSITPNETDARSRRIPQDVKDKVWNRDGGKCVECGTNQNLEFDHIIPFSKGGANTYRNLQLLCESCNRSKSDSIG